MRRGDLQAPSSDQTGDWPPTGGRVTISSMSTGAAAEERMSLMDRPSAAKPSTRLLAAAEADRDRIERELSRIARRAEELARELQQTVELQGELKQQAALLEQLSRPRQLDLSDSSVDQGEEERNAEPPNGYLKGARIRAVAVRLLAASEQAGQPVHYSEWFASLGRAGFGVAGRDPLATFLTQISRSPVVEKTGGPGLYRLNLETPHRLHTRLHELQQELSRLHDGQQTLEAVISIRERRGQITSEIARVERELEEAVAALGIEPEPPDTHGAVGDGVQQSSYA